ncbi:MAG: hypothetical protein ACYDC1_20875 [Limisphaerales bacterium]
MTHTTITISGGPAGDMDTLGHRIAADLGFSTHSAVRLLSGEKDLDINHGLGERSLRSQTITIQIARPETAA